MDRDPSKPQKNGNDRPSAYWTSSRAAGKERKEFKGLCVNCARRYECLLLNSEGGVWHCEAYLEEH
jgi:hypothetical protein